VVFRTLDIGSDKVLSYLPHVEEPNPALGWRAIRVGLDRPSVLRMQLQALLRAAEGRPLSVMFPFVAQMNEFDQARAAESMEIGAMLETPSLAFAPKRFYETVDFVSIGGNDSATNIRTMRGNSDQIVVLWRRCRAPNRGRSFCRNWY